MSTTPAGLPADSDPFSDEVLADPYPTWNLLRESAPAVHLDRYGVWAVGRYDDVRAALRDHAVFSSRGGPGLIPRPEPIDGGLPGSVDPPEHDAFRQAIGGQLGPRHLPRLTDMVRERAERLVASLVERGSFDAVTDLARNFPVDVLGDLVGLPADGREELPRWADAVFDSFGPEGERTEAAGPALAELGAYIVRTVNRETLDPDGMGAAIFAAAAGGAFTDLEAISVIVTFLVSGMGTTADALASAVQLLAENPDQWEALRANPALVPGAFEEVLRYESPFQATCRAVAADTAIGGVDVPAGSRVMLLLGAANRDPRKWADPDRFDVARNPVDHLALGSGVHLCAGQALARMEARALLGALVRRVERIELTGVPRRRLGYLVRTVESLPVAVKPA